MEKWRKYSLTFLAATLCLLATGCTYKYPLKYKLNGRDIVKAQSSVHLKVQVAALADLRPSAEMNKDDRVKQGDRDAGDYTYDNEFTPDMSRQISEMIIKHVNYSGIFDTPVSLAPYASNQISDTRLDELAKSGVDAVMTGEIQHFFGYYDRKLGRELLYGVPLGLASAAVTMVASAAATGGFLYVCTTAPGAYLGLYLESLHHRRIEKSCVLSVRLTSTKTYQPIWEDKLEVTSDERTSMPGATATKRKFQLATTALREAVNKMVEHMQKSGVDALRAL